MHFSLFLLLGYGKIFRKNIKSYRRFQSHTRAFVHVCVCGVTIIHKIIQAKFYSPFICEVHVKFVVFFEMDHRNIK